MMPILMALLVAASIVWYLFVYDRDFTRDMLLAQARNNDLRGNQKMSAWFYNLAYEHSGKDENVAIELANQYKNAGNYTKAEVTLSNAIRSHATSELYTALCRTYVEQDKLLDAVALLENLPNDQIKAVLYAKRPVAPEPDHAPGFYTQYIQVALSNSQGITYYTTDGEYPSVTMPAYAEPIALSTGETQIYAITVGEDGLVSPVTILSYTVGGVIEPAVFMDPVVEAAARAAAGVEEEKILYTSDLWEITEFTAPAGAQTLEDLRMFAYLQTLNVAGWSFRNLEDIAAVSSLNTLVMKDCKIDADALKALTRMQELTNLTMDNCGLSTVADLAGAPKLTYINLANNTIRNLDVFSSMTQLQELDLQHNALTGLDAIGTLPNLGKLNVSYNALTTLAPLSGCSRLYSLDASHNALTNVDGITGLTLLDSLSLDYNQLTDITPLGGCMTLTKLSISNNSITDISRLGALMKLDSLDFAYNQVAELPEWDESAALRSITGSHNAITALDHLAVLKNLSYVYMDYNQLTAVDCLSECYKLVQVNIYGNEVADVSALTDHGIIVNYDPTVK